MASGIEELKALFSSIANQLFISEANAENVICKMSGAGLTVANLADGSIDDAALCQYGINEVEDATLILATAKGLTKKEVDNVEGRPPAQGTLLVMRQSSDSFDGLTGNEPLDIRSLSFLLATVYNWENLGVKLGITMQKLEEIKQQYHGDLEMCKNKLYDMWLRQTTDPSWREIVGALEQIEENSLADKLRKTFLLPGTECDIPYKSSPVKQFSVYESPTLSHIPRSSSIGSEAGHAPVPNVVIVPVAVTLATAPPVANTPSAAPTVLSPVVTPAHILHQGTAILPTSTPPPAFVVPSSSSISPLSATASELKSSEPDPQLIDLLKTMTIEDHQQIDISCKVYNADTNTLIKSTKPPLTRDIRMTRHRVQEFSSSAVPVGTSIRLEIAASCECYMYILNIGTSGKIALLLPNECDSNHFRPNQVYHLPDPELGFEIEGPPGKETLQIFAFSRKQDTLEGFGEKPIKEKELYRDIVIRRKKNIPEDKKGFAQIQFDIVATMN